jgi:hypothetical protein
MRLYLQLIRTAAQGGLATGKPGLTFDIGLQNLLCTKKSPYHPIPENPLDFDWRINLLPYLF